MPKMYRMVLAALGMVSSIACPDAPESVRAFGAAVRTTRDALIPWEGGRQLDAPGNQVRESVTRIVARIQRADYEGDRPALQRLHRELAALKLPHESRHLVSRVRYWQAFALWRRAFNGFNGSTDPKELERDLQQALREFEDAMVRDPQFVDAKVGAISCLQNLAYLSRKDAPRFQELVSRVTRLFKESLATAPENPRLHWVLGAQQWYTPPERGGGQAPALATYERGLELARKQKGRTNDPLEPSWGEAELLMNLAWSNLHRTPPDVRAAEAYADQALALVAYWRYLRDTLKPQIREAR